MNESCADVELIESSMCCVNANKVYTQYMIRIRNTLLIPKEMNYAINYYSCKYWSQ